MKNTMRTLIRLQVGAFLIFYISSCSHKPVNEFKYDPILVSSIWSLKKLSGKPVYDPSLELSFDHLNNRISGYTGCNKLTGSFSIREGKIEISPAAATRFMCPDKESVENKYLKNLSRADSLFLSPDTLKLFNRTEEIATFSKS